MRKRSREAAAPDITPMIDVVFLLLIFFMVSTVFKKDEMALLLNLPKTEKGESVQKEQETAFIELSKTEVAYNGKKTSLEDLEGTLKGITKKTTPIDLRIDKDVKYDRVVLLIGKLKKYELTNVSLITDE